MYFRESYGNSNLRMTSSSIISTLSYPINYIFSPFIQSAAAAAPSIFVSLAPPVELNGHFCFAADKIFLEVNELFQPAHELSSLLFGSKRLD